MQDMKIHITKFSTVPIFSCKRRKTMCAAISSWLSSAFINFLQCSVDPLVLKTQFCKKVPIKMPAKVKLCMP